MRPSKGSAEPVGQCQQIDFVSVDRFRNLRSHGVGQASASIPDLSVRYPSRRLQ